MVGNGESANPCCRSDLFLGNNTQKAFKTTVPLQRGSAPQGVANTCCYLSSGEADFITEIDFLVDGGRCTPHIAKGTEICPEVTPSLDQG